MQRRAEKLVEALDAKVYRELRCFEGHESNVTSVAFSADGKRVLSGTLDMTLRLWDMGTGKELRRFEDYAGRVWSVAFSPDGKRALSGSCDGSIRIWDVETGKELRQVRWSPKGTRLPCGLQPGRQKGVVERQ